MAISRPFLLALVGAVLLGATLFAFQSARNNASTNVTPAAQDTPAGQGTQAAQPAAPGDPVQASSPTDSIKSSLSGDLKSARFRGDLSVTGIGQKGSMTVKGAFEMPAAREVPEFEVYVTAKGSAAAVDAGFVSTGDAGFITQGDTAYRVPGRAWKQVQEAAAKADSPGEQVKLPLAFNPVNWLRDVDEEDAGSIDGVETTHVSASLDVATMVNDLLAAAQGASGAAVPLPDGFQQQATQAVKRADFDVYVGRDDGLLRRARADVKLAPGGSAPVVLTAQLNLTGVNQPQDVKAPANVQAGAPTGPAGVLAQGFLAAVGSTDAAQASSLTALATNNPPKAARAVRDHKKVVIFFRNPRGLEDRAVLKAVRAVDRRTKAVVLTDHVDSVERYGDLVEDLGVSQAPSIVIIDRSGNARLIEGYIDTESLTQAVADAR